jgi:hypothetical protein
MRPRDRARLTTSGRLWTPSLYAAERTTEWSNRPLLHPAVILGSSDSKATFNWHDALVYSRHKSRMVRLGLVGVKPRESH